MGGSNLWQASNSRKLTEPHDGSAVLADMFSVTEHRTTSPSIPLPPSPMDTQSFTPALDTAPGIYASYSCPLVKLRERKLVPEAVSRAQVPVLLLRELLLWFAGRDVLL